LPKLARSRIRPLRPLSTNASWSRLASRLPEAAASRWVRCVDSGVRSPWRATSHPGSDPWAGRTSIGLFSFLGIDSLSCSDVSNGSCLRTPAPVPVIAEQRGSTRGTGPPFRGGGRTERAISREHRPAAAALARQRRSPRNHRTPGRSGVPCRVWCGSDHGGRRKSHGFLLARPGRRRPLGVSVSTRRSSTSPIERWVAVASGNGR
jgi:hypothetical protein